MNDRPYLPTGGTLAGMLQSGLTTVLGIGAVMGIIYLVTTVCEKRPSFIQKEHSIRAITNVSSIPTTLSTNYFYSDSPKYLDLSQ